MLAQSNCLQDRKKVLTRNHPLPTLILELISLQAYEETSFYYLSHTVYGILLWQPEQTKTAG